MLELSAFDYALGDCARVPSRFGASSTIGGESLLQRLRDLNDSAARHARSSLRFVTTLRALSTLADLQERHRCRHARAAPGAEARGQHRSTESFRTGSTLMLNPLPAIRPAFCRLVVGLRARADLDAAIPGGSVAGTAVQAYRADTTDTQVDAIRAASRIRRIRRAGHFVKPRVPTCPKSSRSVRTEKALDLPGRDGHRRSRAHQRCVWEPVDSRRDRTRILALGTSFIRPTLSSHWHPSAMLEATGQRKLIRATSGPRSRWWPDTSRFPSSTPPARAARDRGSAEPRNGCCQRRRSRHAEVWGRSPRVDRADWRGARLRCRGAEALLPPRREWALSRIDGANHTRLRDLERDPLALGLQDKRLRDALDEGRFELPVAAVLELHLEDRSPF